MTFQSFFALAIILCSILTTNALENWQIHRSDVPQKSDSLGAPVPVSAITHNLENGKVSDLVHKLTSNSSINARRADCESEEDNDCKEICGEYVNINMQPILCTRRTKEVFLGYRSTKVYYYWTISKCVTYENAERLCDLGKGKIAIFRDGSDRVFASGYISGLMNIGPHCSDGRDNSSPNMNFIWAALTSKTMGEWVWNDGKTESPRNPVAWNSDIRYFKKHTMYSFDQRKLCSIMGWNGVVWDPSEFASGFDPVNCDYRAKVVCVKEVPAWH